MQNNTIITKCVPTAPYKNNTMLVLTTGQGNFETRDTYVEPTGTFADQIFSPSGSMNWPERYQLPGQTVYTEASP